MPAGPEGRPWTSHADWLKARYGQRVWRVAVDGGFSCPHRRGGAGCTYCGGEGARAPYLDGVPRPDGPGDLEGVRRQVERAVAFLRSRYRAQSFLLYFQAFTATWAPLAVLAALWEGTIPLAPFRELIVATRPD